MFLSDDFLKNPYKIIGLWLFMLALLLWRFLSSTVYGFFVISLFVYFYSLEFFGVEPYAVKDLILHISSLEKEYKIAIVSSTITVVGFLLAFTSSRAAVKEELLLQYKTQLADEVIAYTNEVSSLLTSVKIKAEYLLELKKDIEENPLNPDLPFNVSWINGQESELARDRIRLSSLASQGFTLNGNHAGLLCSTGGLDVKFSRVVDCISELAGLAWISIPNIKPTSIAELEEYGAYIDSSEMEDYVELYEEYFSVINSHGGSIRYMLMSGIIDYKFGHLRAIVSMTNPLARKKD